MLVKNGNLQLEVPRDFDGGVSSAMQVVQRKAAAFSGLVESSNAYSHDTEEQRWRRNVASGRAAPDEARPKREIQSASLTLRIPAKRFDEFMESLGKLNFGVLSTSSNLQDVTDQYVDTVARLHTQQAALKQLEQIMQQATQVHDMTAVQNRMMVVVETLERHKASQLRLERQAAMSTVQVNLNLQGAGPQPPPPITVPAWSPFNSIHRAYNQLIVSAQWIIDSFILAVLVGVPVAGVLAMALLGAVQGLSKALSYFAGDLGAVVTTARMAAGDVASASSSREDSPSTAGARLRPAAALRSD
jgi:hypothetical protein